MTRLGLAVAQEQARLAGPRGSCCCIHVAARVPSLQSLVPVAVLYELLNSAKTMYIIEIM